MSTSIYDPSGKQRNDSTPSRHRRSTVSLHSPPGLGLIKTISKDLITGWHTHTALQKEPSTPTPSVDAKTPYKPKHAAKDAMKSFPPATSCNADSAKPAKTSHEHSSERARQDSLLPTPTEIDGTKPLACVEEGLIPDHRNDTWTAVWDTAYERRNDPYDCPFPCPLWKDTTSYAKFPGSSSPKSTSATPKTERRRSSRSSRPPLSSSFTVTDAEIKAFIFENHNRRTQGHESPEAFLIPKSNRKGSEVPSIAPSLISSEGSQESGLEDLEERREEEENEGVEEVEIPGREVGRGGKCRHCLRCGGCTRRGLARG